VTVPIPLFDFPWWGYVLAALALTHVTILSVTIFLHRHQAHMAVDLHPAVSHFFRFWLWLTTGIATKEWVAVHRKHHAKVETPEDPHSPAVYGIQRVLWTGAFLYRKAAREPGILEKYGRGTPTDWLERNLYLRYTFAGILLMLAADLLLFGLPGLGIWAVQMVWIPFWAAGVINGVGHYAGYRNWEVPDTSTNIVPWGILIGGEELHNNHHAYAGSAKFSMKPWEFDLAWGWIRALQSLGLASVKKTAPEVVVKPGRSFGLETLKIVINHRFQVMADYVREVSNRVCLDELRKTGDDSSDRTLIRLARRLLAREPSLLSELHLRYLREAVRANAALAKVYTMKQKLQEIWSRSATSQDQLLAQLEEWCRNAEASGIEALRQFANRLRQYALAPEQAFGDR
jgi:stearoyl-CoA desaturase (delta-9 desaturase)